MGRAGPDRSPGLLIRHAPLSRRQKMARLRTIALTAVAAVAVSGIVLQKTRPDEPRGAQIASASPFQYFPG